MSIKYEPITVTTQFNSYIQYMGDSAIQGSNDRTNWTLLGSFPPRWYLAKLDITGDYRYIRLFTPINLPPSVSHIQVGKFYFI
jgi:hypothetical protein